MSNSNGAQTNPSAAQAGRRQFGEMGKWARYYDFVMALLTFGKEKKLRQVELEFCKLHPGERVLEIGCGTGTLTLAAKDRVGPSGEVIGLDLAPEMIEKARSKATRKNAHVSFRQGSVASLPFPSGYFDTVLCSFMIFHMPEDVRTSGIAEIRRVLKPGSQLCIIDGESLEALAANLNENSFVETQQEESKFGYMKLHFLRAKAANAC